MPAFGEQLGDVDIAAIVTFTRNAYGNNTGDITQPKEVAEARKIANIITAESSNNENVVNAKSIDIIEDKTIIGGLADVR